MSREPIPTWFFALVVVRLGPRFLVVHERKHGRLWYLPAGRVEPGETLEDGARRETLEETGVPVVLDGVLRVEHSPTLDGARVRVIYVAHPQDDTPPKTVADEHSLEAAWRTLAELEAMAAARLLRGHGFLRLLRAVEAGAPVHPLSLFGEEEA